MIFGRRSRSPYELYLQDYKSDGEYIQYGQRELCGIGDGLKLDEQGVALSMVTGEPKYHPVLTAQCGLRAHGRIARGKDEDAAKANMVLYADKLLELQDPAGAFRYPFAFKYYLLEKPLPAGWVSAMAQGQGLSLLSRAYLVTHDQKYLAAGQKALSAHRDPVNPAMQRPKRERVGRSAQHPVGVSTSGRRNPAAAWDR